MCKHMKPVIHQYNTPFYLGYLLNLAEHTNVILEVNMV